mmetsp:Transcript_7516/g.14256  ORF Transcript_7516/g.14256 Transcript_7516/m.14256 type:complete len:255 (-) Transcript_7516:239-1003(-)
MKPNQAVPSVSKITSPFHASLLAATTSTSIHLASTSGRAVHLSTVHLAAKDRRGRSRRSGCRGSGCRRCRHGHRTRDDRRIVGRVVRWVIVAIVVSIVVPVVVSVAGAKSGVTIIIIVPWCISRSVVRRHRRWRRGGRDGEARRKQDRVDHMNDTIRSRNIRSNNRRIVYHDISHPVVCTPIPRDTKGDTGSIYRGSRLTVREAVREDSARDNMVCENLCQNVRVVDQIRERTVGKSIKRVVCGSKDGKGSSAG